MFGIYADTQMTMSKTLVWISGNTYPVRAELKADGFKWSAKKRAWWMPITEYESKIANVNSSEDHTIMGTGADGSPVVIAECHNYNPHDDLDYALGY